MQDSLVSRVAKLGALPRSWIVGLAATIALGALLWVVTDGDDGSPDPRRFASTFQSYTAFDYTPLINLGFNLDSASDGITVNDHRLPVDLVGMGTVVDVRLSFVESTPNPDGTAEEFQHMAVVVKPSSGGDDILIDTAAPPIDRETGERGMDVMKDSLVGAQLVYILSATSPQEETSTDSSVVRNQIGDADLYETLHPSTLLAVEGRVAFPLLTDEDLADSRKNLGFFRDQGVDVQELTTAEPIGNS